MDMIDTATNTSPSTVAQTVIPRNSSKQNINSYSSNNEIEDLDSKNPNAQISLEENLKIQNKNLQNQITVITGRIKVYENDYLEKTKSLTNQIKNFGITEMNYKNQIENKNKTIQKLQTENKYLKEQINEMEEIFISLKKEVKNLLITKKEDEEWLIDETLKNLNYEKDKKPKIILLYKASQDGDNINDFHKLCDNCNNTLIIIKSPNGNIFGGFTTQYWNNIIQINNKAKEKLDNKAFLFNLNDRNIYKSKNGKGICTNSSYPIVFGSVNSFELYIQKNCLTNGGGCQTGSVFTNNTYIAGSNNFSISELEVYHII